MRIILQAAQFGCFLSLFLAIGCSHVPLIGNPSSSPDRQTRSSETFVYVQKGNIMNAQALMLGKNIAVVPFSAGVGVEANETLDKIALMIVKGLSDAMIDGEKQEGALTVVTAENTEASDFIVQGRITRVQTPSKARRWIMMNGQKSLEVDGKMIDVRTGETVLAFSDGQRTAVTSEDHAKLGYRIGKNIGMFILSAAQ